MLNLDHEYWTVPSVNTELINVGGTRIDAELLGRVLAERRRVLYLGLDAPVVAVPEATRTISPMQRVLALLRA